ncbi:MAG: 50S ribosomal protein L25 [Verrucomicrobia bacterium CG_4_10_14_3_um_filter_43_23]|nr:MAG: hypothetical protein AUJ82_03855 [Verrucomicrobia bacterium CG1_02_43_26]PIP59344.1 MAG: 50S ribosomal protein L25 [Verrucomicrobia bacterium CG22_combo_CG10-13_8_21_14_all_43_17]PIX57969.1 MAG: 50S ribosomal protein L25 [Verrucomicrobia bacterium CG_4_10_14_3_um_filter_43_23]PIY62829.1 MAG: 50S ribosomal protein L25 [Verrucomicrobia bacterium CG_4_10_14_0_8_um_filter_43_34]PJA44704.1 MAG: 50S ribosomal protein L25 [Verrucomicrobia bacterium CG_4_9_14_3_um_filter_43_20]
MKKLELTVSLREEKGRGPAGRMRRAGQLPGVIYGKSGSISISVNARDFMFFMRKASGSVVLIELSVDGKDKKLAVIQEIQRNPLNDRYEHVDFHELSANEEMSAHIPVHIIGESTGVKNENGLLDVHLHAIDVKCLPAKLPEYIEIDVSNLHVGEAIHIADLKPIEGVTFTGHAEISIVSCAEPRVKEEETEAEAAPEAVAAESA